MKLVVLEVPLQHHTEILDKLTMLTLFNQCRITLSNDLVMGFIYVNTPQRVI